MSEPPPLVHVAAANAWVRHTVSTVLACAGLSVTPAPVRPPGGVVVAVGDTIAAAIATCPPVCRSGGYALLIIADRVGLPDVVQAIRIGARAFLRTTDVTAAQLAAAVRSAGHGDGWIRYGLLARLLGAALAPATAPAAAAGPPTVVGPVGIGRHGGPPGAGGHGALPSPAGAAPVGWELPRPRRSAPVSPLTPRQATVLTLVAEGHGNAAIARTLGCSEHTVKNIVYEAMARLQARNRAHAVSLAMRAGLL